MEFLEIRSFVGHEILGARGPATNFEVLLATSFGGRPRGWGFISHELWSFAGHEILGA